MFTKRTVKSAKSVGFVWKLLQLFWYLGWLAAILLFGLLVMINFTDFRIKYVHLPVEVSYENIDGQQVASPLTSPSSVAVVGFSDLVVEADLMADYMGVMLLIPSLLMVGYLMIVFHLRRFLQTVREGNPFVPENPKRLRLIGWLVTLGAPVMGLLTHIYGRVFVHFVKIPGATLEVTKDIYPFVIIPGLIILVIAHVFEIGVKIQEEQNLTI